MDGAKGVRGRSFVDLLQVLYVGVCTEYVRRTYAQTFFYLGLHRLKPDL